MHYNIPNDRLSFAFISNIIEYDYIFRNNSFR